MSSTRPGINGMRSTTATPPSDSRGGGRHMVNQLISAIRNLDESSEQRTQLLRARRATCGTGRVPRFIQSVDSSSVTSRVYIYISISLFLSTVLFIYIYITYESYIVCIYSIVHCIYFKSIHPYMPNNMLRLRFRNAGFAFERPGLEPKLCGWY